MYDYSEERIDWRKSLKKTWDCGYLRQVPLVFNISNAGGIIICIYIYVYEIFFEIGERNCKKLNDIVQRITVHDYKDHLAAVYSKKHELSKFMNEINI